MSTRRQRRSPKWLKRQDRKRKQAKCTSREVSIGVDHAQEPSRAVLVDWVEVGGQRLAMPSQGAGLTWGSVTITLDGVGADAVRVEDRLARLVSKPKPYLNRVQRRARGL